MKPLIAVIADDLTGVCDTGAQFASAGLRPIGSVNTEKTRDQLYSFPAFGFEKNSLTSFFYTHIIASSMGKPGNFPSIGMVLAGRSRTRPEDRKCLTLMRPSRETREESTAPSDFTFGKISFRRFGGKK